MMLARLVIMVVTILNSYFKNIFSASLTTSGRATIIMSASSISHSTRSNDSTDKHIMQRIYNAVDTIDQANGVTFNRLLSNPLSDVNIVRAMGLIDSLSLDDIGVDDLYLKDLGSPSAFRGYSSVCLNVVTKANFHISVFVLRSPRSTLPLHDHPNMLVLSKVTAYTNLTYSAIPHIPHRLTSRSLRVYPRGTARQAKNEVIFGA